jgi:hypothetical protein
MSGSAVAGPLFFFCGGMVFLLGVLGKCGVLLWCFCGEFVVECVVNVVSFRSLLWRLEMGQGFELYFGGEGKTEATTNTGSSPIRLRSGSG